MINLPPGADVLGAMITPAVLISASGMLTLATTNRMGRVVDRIRALGEIAETITSEASTPNADEKRSLISNSLTVLARRMKLLQTALSLFFFAIGILIFTSILLGLSISLDASESIYPAVTGLIGATSMFIAVVLLVIETRLAVRSTLMEMDYARRLIERAVTTNISLRPPSMH